MKKSAIVGMFWGAYLGGAITGFFGAGLTDIRWWLTFVPVVLLTVWEKRLYKDEDN